MKCLFCSLSLWATMIFPAFCQASVSDSNLPPYAVELLRESYKINSSSYKPSDDEGALQMRLKALGVEAFSWGVQEGAHFRNDQIQNLLEANSFTLNKVANFSKFIIDGSILMPTVLAAENIYAKTSDSETRTVNTSYTLDKPPKFVSQPPTWRDYLKRSLPLPRRPIDQAHPKTVEEKKVWDREFKKGWSQGVIQADSIYARDLNKLLADLAGLYRFRYLLAQNIVTLPTVAKDKNSYMLLDSGKTINLNDVKYTIILDSTFKKISDWQPVFNRGSAHD